VISGGSTVFVVDDDPAVRHSLTRLLEAAGYRTRSFETAEAFLAAGVTGQPGCLLLDVRMPTMGGLELQAALRQQGCPLPVIIITGHADVPMAVAAMKAGAADLIEKPFDDELLLLRIAEVMARDTERHTQAARRAAVHAHLNALTPREREVLDGLVNCRTVEEIAAALRISPKTVYMHRGHVMDKLGVHSLSELVRMVLSADGAAPGPWVGPQPPEGTGDSRPTSAC